MAGSCTWWGLASRGRLTWPTGSQATWPALASKRSPGLVETGGEGEISPKTQPLSSVQSGPPKAALPHPTPMTTEGAAGQQARWKWPPYQPDKLTDRKQRGSRLPWNRKRQRRHRTVGDRLSATCLVRCGAVQGELNQFPQIIHTGELFPLSSVFHPSHNRSGLIPVNNWHDVSRGKNNNLRNSRK